MKSFCKSLIHLFLFLFSLSCIAQDLVFNVQFFDQRDGLSDRSIYAINQDDRGLIWIGTGNGLNLFDGQKFRVIGEQNSRTFAGNIFKIRKNKDGDFWIQKERESVIYFDPYKEEIIPLPNDRFDDLELLSPLGPEENVWFKNKENTIYYLDEKGDLINFSKTKDLTQSRVVATSWNTLLIDDFSLKKKFEINETGDTLRAFDNVLPAVYDEASKCFQMVVNRPYDYKYLNEVIFEINREGELKPFNLFINDRPFSFKDIGIEGGVNCSLQKDNQGNYWFIARNKVFFFDKNRKFQKEISAEIFDLTNSTWNVNDVLIDDENRIWLATGIGLLVIEVRENPFQLYLDESGRTSTRGIVSNSKNEIFIANYLGAKKVHKYSKEIIDSYSFYGLGAARITSNKIWIGSLNSIYVLDEKSDAISLVEINQMRETDVYSFLVDEASGIVYLGTSKGLWISDVEASAFYKYDKLNEFEEVAEVYISHFIENEEGIWLATKNGIYLLDLQKGIVEHVQFLNNKIKFIHEDENGDFWMATQGGGLIHWDRTSNIKHQITTKDGLSHNVIYAVYEDEFEYLWLPSNNGLMRFEKETREVDIFQPEDGIAHQEFNTFSHHQAEDGRFYFGGLNGVTAFYPKELESKQNYAPFIVTQLQQFDAAEGKLVNKTKDFQINNKITLAPFDKFFTIDFSLLDYASQDHIYAWKIKGLDEEWNYQTGNSIRINALNYGEYTLQIKAKGTGGQWAKEQLQIPVFVQKPFYLKTPFMLVSALLLGLLVYFVFRSRTLWLRRSREKLKIEVEERTMELSEKNIELEASNQIKDKLFAIIAHDLRGPAFSLQDVGQKINYLIESQQTERLKDFGDTVDESVSRLISLLNNLLNWANQNLKTTTLNPEKLNVQKLTKNALEEVKDSADKKSINLEFDISPTFETYSDEQAVLTITRNLLSNAIKFTPPNGAIKLMAEQQSKTVLLSIQDNGVGIDPKRISHIFDLRKNKSTRGTNGEKGTGLGLNVSKELAVLNGGDIKVESTVGKGTAFTIILPTV